MKKKNADYIVVDGSKIIYVNEWLSQTDEEGKGVGNWTHLSNFIRRKQRGKGSQFRKPNGLHEHLMMLFISL